MIEAKGVTVHYPGSKRAALFQVDIDVRPGELLVVAGPNGSGKTTLQRALLGLVPLAEGSVMLSGYPIDRLPRSTIAQRIGALPQREDASIPLSVQEAVLLGRWAHLGPISPVTSDELNAVAEALTRCDLTRMDQRNIDTLSGGEWQRVRLARALVASPTFLLLDEPTAALDLAHEMELFELLRRLVAQGLGVLVITHQLNLALRFADRVVLLDAGKVEAAGTARDVLRPDLLSQVFRWPVTVTVAADGTPTIAPTRRSQAETPGFSAPYSTKE